MDLLKKYSQNKKKLYQGAILLVMVLFIYFILNTLIPGIFLVYDLYNDYQISGEQIEREMRWQEKLISLKRDINKIRNDIEGINLEIPAERNLSAPLNYLDSLRISNNVELNSFEVLSIDTSRQYKIALLTTNFSGKFNNLKKFISEMENGSFIISIKGIKLELQSLFRQEIEAIIELGIILRRDRKYKI